MASSTGKEQAVRGRLPAARRDRRPALAALAILLILLGALGSALIAFRTSEKVSVLVAIKTIPVGAEVEAGDFAAIRVASDSDPSCGGGGTCSFVPSASLKQFVGSRAQVSIPAGSVISPQQFGDQRPIPADAQLVGVQLSATQRTSTMPAVGDVVALQCVAGSAQSDDLCSGADDTIVEAARVVAVSDGSTSDQSIVTVLVSNQSAPRVANLASSGNIAMTLRSDDTTPDPDVDTPES